MRKKLIYLLVMLMVIGMSGLMMTGCFGEDVAEEPPVEEPPVEEPPVEEEPVRVGVIYSIPDPARGGGWDRAQYAGHSLLEDEFGWEVSIAEEVPFPKQASTAAAFAEKGFDIVVFTSAGHVDAWMEVAPQYPDTWFLLMSVVTELPASDNVAAWSPDMYVYGNVVGAIKALLSETNVISNIGGVPIPALEELFSGVIEGAKAINPEIETLVGWVGDWVDKATHNELTRLHIEQGADIIFTVTGPGTFGVYEAADAGGAYVLGYAFDMYEDAPGTIITSLVFDTSTMYRDMAEAFLDGTLTRKIVPVGADLFTLADFRGKVTPEKEAEILATMEKIVTGEIEIPRVMHDLN